jgi:hypothetical protein
MEKALRFFQEFVRRPGVRWSLVAVCVYTLATLAMTYPVPLHLNSVIIGDEGGDAYQYTWSLWWARRAMLDPGERLAHLSLMNHPAGISHPFMLTMVGVDLVALPFSLLFPPPVVYNLQVLLSFVLSGLTMYWLCTELAGDCRAGLVGGFIFAFFLNKTGHVVAGHLPQVTVYGFPLYVLFLWRTVRRPGWSNVLIAALTLAFSCLVHVMHVVYFVLPITAAVLLIGLLEWKGAFFTWRRLGSLAILFGLAALIASPFLFPTLSRSVQDDGYLYKVGTVDHSIDLLAFFTPSSYHPVLGPLGLLPAFAEEVFYDEETLYEGLAYPGALAVGLAAWGLVRQKRRAWVWGALALMAGVLSLGPLLKVGNELVLYQVDAYRSHVVLPYALLKQVPLLRVGRTPGRLNEIVMFAVAILASYGVAALVRWLDRRPRLLAGVLVAALIGIGFESVAIWPFPVSTTEIPPVVQRVAGEPGDGAMLYASMKSRWVNHRALYYQTVARRPIVGGEVHRAVPEALPWSEMLLGLAQPDEELGDIVPLPSPAGRRAWLRHFGVDTVLFTKREDRDESAHREFIERFLGRPKVEDDTLAAFQVPEDGSALESSYLYAFSRQGWDAPKRDGDQWQRWMYDEARLYVYSTRAQEGSLRFTVDSDLEPPVLSVYAGERLLDSFFTAERATYTTRPFTLAQGMNDLHFRAAGGCPEELGDRATCGTFVFDDVAFVPQASLPAGETLDVNLGDRVWLRGWRTDGPPLHASGVLTVVLDWETAVQLTDQYVGFVHLLSPDGTLVAQHDGPLAEGFPSSALVPPGAVFRSLVTLDLPENLLPGDYRLLAGVYLWPSLERLPVLADVAGAEAREVELGRVEIVP